MGPVKIVSFRKKHSALKSQLPIMTPPQQNPVHLNFIRKYHHIKYLEILFISNQPNNITTFRTTGPIGSFFVPGIWKGV